MLKDTLFYVSKNLEDAWEKRETHCAEEVLQQSIFLKAIRELTGINQSQSYDTMALCLGISRADVEEFINLAERQRNIASGLGKEEDDQQA